MNYGSVVVVLSRVSELCGSRHLGKVCGYPGVTGRLDHIYVEFP